MNIGILHPGQMGVVIAITARNSGHQVRWAPDGRSAATRRRAEEAGLTDGGSLAELASGCSMLISVCPPEFAEPLAEEVAAHGFRGTYVDANAISPQRAQRIAAAMERDGIQFVDGGIIGLPSLAPGRTWLCLSGAKAKEVAECFAAGPVSTEVLEGGAGRASALKMCFAAYSKGSTALACGVLAAAERLDVLEDLYRQWSRHGPAVDHVEQSIRRAAPKAWRWVAEMHEIAATLDGAAVPAGFHQAAAEIFHRLRDAKDSELSLDEILEKLTSRKRAGVS